MRNFFPENLPPSPPSPPKVFVGVQDSNRPPPLSFVQEHRECLFLSILARGACVSRTGPPLPHEPFGCLSSLGPPTRQAIRRHVEAFPLWGRGDAVGVIAVPLTPPFFGDHEMARGGGCRRVDAFRLLDTAGAATIVDASPCIAALSLTGSGDGKSVWGRCCGGA